MQRKKISLYFLILWCCVGNLPAHAVEKLKIVATFSILADMAQTVAGDNAEVLSLIGPEGEVHDYEPTPRNLVALKKADLIVMNGLHLEGSISRAIKNAKSKAPVISMGEQAIPLGLTLRNMGMSIDPHIWNSPQNGIAMVKLLAQELQKIDSPHAAVYQKNAETYIAQLQALDAQFKARFANMPTHVKRYLMPHDSLGYLGSAYGLEFISPSGLSSHDTPNARKIAEILEECKKNNIRVAFLENIGNKKLITQMTKDAHIAIGGVLYPESLTIKGGQADTYIKLLNANLSALLAASESLLIQ